MQISVRAWPCMGWAYVSCTITNATPECDHPTRGYVNPQCWLWQDEEAANVRLTGESMTVLAERLLAQESLPIGWVEHLT
jgi:hypothetical protein